MLVASLAATCVAVVTSGIALAETFEVTKSSDTRDGHCDADCSLREAIIAANQLGGADEVMLPAGLYRLQQAGREEDEARAGDLDILDDLTILGEGAPSTRIDANQIDRILDVRDAAVVRVVGLALENGRAEGDGGAVRNNGTLTIDNCILRSNSAGDGDGGAVYSEGQGSALTVQGCTIEGNSASSGGAILNDAGMAILAGTRLANNAANLTGGAIQNEGDSAGLTLEGCEVSGNAAPSGGGLHNNGGAARLTNTTIGSNSARFGAGISNIGYTAELTLEGCEITGGLGLPRGAVIRNALNGGGIYNVHGTVMLIDTRLDDNRAAQGAGLYNTGDATLKRCSVSNAPVGEGLLSGGDGVDRNATLTVDDCTIAGNYGAGVSNLGHATLTNTTLVGNSPGVTNDGDLLVDRCTLTENVGTSGAGILNNRTVRVVDSVIAGNAARRGDDFFPAGGIYSGGEDATLTMERCTVIQNSAEDGGAIYQYSGSALVIDTTLSSNSATGTGGAIFNRGALVLVASTLNDNRAGYGGALLNGGGQFSSATATLSNCTLSGNSAATDGAGGAIHNNFGTLTMEACTVSGNTAGVGAAIYNADGSAMVANTIIANSAEGENCDEPIQSKDHNLDDDGSCGFFEPGDLSIVTANLAPLGEYGGETRTHALCTGAGRPHPSCAGRSAAIDAGFDDEQCMAADQRGGQRPQGLACDVGAFESDADAPPTRTRTVTPTSMANPTSSPSGTPTATPHPSITNSRSPTGTLTPTVTVRPMDTPAPTEEPSVTHTATAAPTPSTTRSVKPATFTPTVRACSGDCNGSYSVMVNELVTAVNIALGNEPLSRCPALDSDADGVAAIPEVIRAVGALLNGCP